MVFGMKYFRLVLSVASLLGFAATISAQQSLTLSEALQKALERNYPIRVAKADLAVAENNNDWSLTNRYPSVNLTVNTNNTYSNTSNPASILFKSSVLNTSIVPGLETNWIIFDGHRADINKGQLEGQYKLSAGQLRQQIEQTMLAVIQAYHGVLVQREQLGILAGVLNLSRDRVDYQQLRQSFGQANTFDLLQARDAYLSDSTTFLVQQTLYQNSMRNLLQLIGEDPATAPSAYVLADQLVADGIAYDYTELADKLLANNQQLMNLVMARELASLNTRLLETNTKPTIALRAGMTYNTGIGFGVQTFNFVSGQVEQDVPRIAAKNLNTFLNVSMVYNLFDKGARRRQIGSARLAEISSQLSYESQKQLLLTQLANVHNTYNNQRSLVQLTKELVDNAQRNLSIAEERLRAGLINSFDYRTVQLGYLTATQTQLNALLNLKNTETELLRLTGELIR